MNKKQWQDYNGFDDDEVEKIIRMKTMFFGFISAIRNIPKDSEGSIIPFKDRKV